MTLLEDIQSAATDGSCDLATLLRKCKVLAARLGSQPLEDWVLWESNGYPDNISVPDYRIWPLEVRGHFSGPFGSELRNAPISLQFIPEKSLEKYQQYEVRQSIAGIEDILKDGRRLIQVSTGDLWLFLGQDVYKKHTCIGAWAEFSVGHLVEVVNSVRNRILDFSLAVWKESPTAGEIAGTNVAKLEKAKVTQIFNTTVYGGTANLVGTARESIVFNIIEKDILSLEKILRKNGVQDDDIAELQEAFRTEPEAKSDKNFGPKVSDWISRMIKKAADGSWNIGLEVAGNLLSQAITKYYGLGS